MSSETPTSPFLGEFASVNVFKDEACSKVMKLIRTSNDLARASDHDFLMSFQPLRRRMDKIAEKILHNVNVLLRNENLNRNLGGSSWKDVDHEEKIDKLIDINDILFERISSSLDEAAGLKKAPEVKLLVPSIRNVPATWSKNEGFVLQEKVQPIRQRRSHPGVFSLAQQNSKNIPKSQLKFTDKVDNNVTMPFIPKIRVKPNAKTPLPVMITQIEDPWSGDQLLLEKHPE
ncbi:unnamed protein product, partial [Didymodactylos carnosus]